MYYLYETSCTVPDLKYKVISDNGYVSLWTETAEEALAKVTYPSVYTPETFGARIDVTLILTFDETTHPEYFI